VPSVGRVRFGLIEQAFGSLEAAWRAGTAEFRSAGLDQAVVEAISTARARVDPHREMELLRAAGIAGLTWHDTGYPPMLREIDDLPPVLYVEGTITPEDHRSVTIVGTRRPTAYGKEVTRHLAGELARAGVTVVSGLARGGDGIAHRAALEAGGRTLAVMGSGSDVIYPPEHTPLAHEIVGNGAVITEYPLGVKPDPRHFPRRNRLLSGLSMGTLVVEASDGSGTQSTVRSALEQGRDVFCVPGSIYWRRACSPTGGSKRVRSW
jgi:DNA processing protein